MCAPGSRTLTRNLFGVGSSVVHALTHAHHAPAGNLPATFGERRLRPCLSSAPQTYPRLCSPMHDHASAGKLASPAVHCARPYRTRCWVAHCDFSSFQGSAPTYLRPGSPGRLGRRLQRASTRLCGRKLALIRLRQSVLAASPNQPGNSVDHGSQDLSNPMEKSGFAAHRFALYMGAGARLVAPRRVHGAPRSVHRIRVATACDQSDHRIIGGRHARANPATQSGHAHDDVLRAVLTRQPARMGDSLADPIAASERR